MMQITVHNSGANGIIKIADKVLDKYSLSNDLGIVPLNIKGQATISVLSKIQSKSYFDVCSVDKLAELHNVVIPSDIQRFMSALHCVDWNTMTSETRDYLMAVLVKTFEAPIKQSEL